MFVFKSSLFLLQSEVISSQSGIVNLQNDPSIFNGGSNDLDKTIIVNKSWLLFFFKPMSTCPSVRVDVS